MASSKEFLDFVLDQLSPLEGVTYRPMMGEYLLYLRGKLIGGVYDDRLLLKPTEPAKRLIAENGRTPETAIPYEGAKAMLAADPDDRELLCRIAEATAAALPEKKRKG